MRGAVSGDTYYASLKSTILQISRDTGKRIPWLVANVSYCPGLPDTLQQRRLTRSIRQAQQKLWQEGLALPGPDTDLLIGPAYRLPKSPHFSAQGLRAHAELWFQKLLSSGLLSPTTAE